MNYIASYKLILHKIELSRYKFVIGLLQQIIQFVDFVIISEKAINAVD